ncbi:Uncharacterised protein [Mycobacteroides abscessus subsp. abscessus]|nr:Uncharacterised protein [Mycobacteroides abscessus subsp. abscessus]
MSTVSPGCSRARSSSEYSAVPNAVVLVHSPGSAPSGSGMTAYWSTRW